VHDGRHTVKVFELQQGQEAIGCCIHTVKLMTRLLLAVPICEDTLDPLSAPVSLGSSRKTQLGLGKSVTTVLFQEPSRFHLDE
jgi:hypothetical protein